MPPCGGGYVEDYGEEIGCRGAAVGRHGDGVMLLLLHLALGEAWRL